MYKIYGAILAESGKVFCYDAKVRHPLPAAPEVGVFKVGAAAGKTAEGQNMKPRLIKINGVWHCCLLGEWRDPGFIRFCGLGYTPAEAYRDWIACNYAP